MQDAGGNGNRSENIVSKCHIGWIINISVNIRQAAATRERIVADGGDRVGDSHTRQVAAIIERITADGGDRVGDNSVLAASY